MPQMIFLEKGGKRRVCAFTAGETILKVAQRNKIDIEGACGGAMACSTCHIIVTPEWRDKLPKPTAEESDLLDLAPGVTRNSRLGCQILLTPGLDGLTVSLP